MFFRSTAFCLVAITALGCEPQVIDTDGTSSTQTNTETGSAPTSSQNPACDDAHAFDQSIELCIENLAEYDTFYWSVHEYPFQDFSLVEGYNADADSVPARSYGVLYDEDDVSWACFYQHPTVDSGLVVFFTYDANALVEDGDVDFPASGNSIHLTCAGFQDWK